MLRIVVAILAFCAAGYAQEAHDIRSVNGISVDIQPVKDWFKDQKGSRPMKHWKRLRVLEVKEPLATWERCIVETESKQKVELLMVNVPQDSRAFLQKLSSVTKQVDTLTAAVENDTVSERAAWNKFVSTPLGNVSSEASTRGYSSESGRTRFNNYTYWRDKLETDTDQLAKMRATRDALLVEYADKAYFFAMFTGRRYSNLEVWDCGKRVDPQATR